MSCSSLLIPLGLLGPFVSFSESSAPFVLPLLAGLVWLGLRTVRHRVRDRHESELGNGGIDPDLARRAKAWLDRLTTLGFHDAGVWRCTDAVGNEQIVWRRFCTEWKAVAVLRGADRIEREGRPAFSLSFHTFLEDGRYLVTADPGIYEGEGEGWSLLERRFREVEGQWNHHQQRVATSGADARVPGNPSHAVLAREREPIEAAVSAGRLAPVKRRTGFYRPTLRSLPELFVKQALQAVRGGGPREFRRDLERPTEGESGEFMGFRQLPVEQMAERDLDRYRRLMDRRSLHPLMRLLLLAVVLELSCRAFTGMSGARTVATTLAILFLHGLGHWLPMKLFRFRGARLAVLTGLSRVLPRAGAPLWQQLTVVLGGPLPGLLAGAAILAGGRMDPSVPDVWLNTAVMAVALNGLSLLPFRPFDGGQVVELLFFRRHPRLRVLFTATATAAVAAAAFHFRESWLVAAVGMLAVSLWLDLCQLRYAKAARGIHWQVKGGEDETVLRRIFRERRQKGGTHVGSRGWHLKTRAMLERAAGAPGWMSRLVGGWVYASACLLLLLGVGAMALASMSGEALPWARHMVTLAEFKRQMPKGEAPPVDENRVASLQALQARTIELVGEECALGPEPISNEDWIDLAEGLGRGIDQLDWEEVAAAHHGERIDTAGIWLEVARLRLERSLAARRWDESLRRAEILLHAVSQLRPVDHADFLLGIQRAERWALTVVAVSFGKLPLTEKDLSRLRDRVAVLRTPVEPEREAFRLVDGWGSKRAPELETARESIGERRHFPSDAARVRESFTQAESVWELVGSWGRGGGAVPAVARHWIATGGGSLPVSLPEGELCSEEEAEYLRDFCRRRDRLDWTRMAVLAAIRLELYQGQSGALPGVWRHEVAGGAVLELQAGEPPLLTLDESPTAWQPEWLPPGESEKPFHLEIPLGRVVKPKPSTIAGP